MEQTEITIANLALLKTFEPKELWRYFATISSIPRESRNEGLIADYIVQIAKENNCTVVTRDAYNNILIRVPATEGWGHHKMVCLQSHMDMVCTPDGNIFPIQFYLSGDGRLHTNGESTLGADNGVGLCAMLAIITDKKVQHGPLEMLFTTVEEVGLEGAKAFDASLIQSTEMINLDSEVWGEIVVGCAGGAVQSGYFTPEYFIFPDNEPSLRYEIHVAGLNGGHSGRDIAVNRGNSIKILAELLLEFGDLVRLTEFKGGTKMNVIPSTAVASVVVKNTKFKEFELAFQKAYHALTPQYSNEALQITFHEAGGLSRAMTPASQTAFLKLLSDLPNGVLEKQPDEKMVRTSNNVALVEAQEGEELKIQTFCRSFSNEEADQLSKQIELLFFEAGCRTEMENSFVSWDPEYDTPLLNSVVREYKGLFDEEPKVTVSPGGLECAIFLANRPGLSAVSFGPTIDDPHGVKESVDIASVGKFWQYLLEVLTYL